MKFFKEIAFRSVLAFMVLILASVFIGGCDRVPAGYVGVKVYLLGGEKGVDSEELGPGRYWIGINEDLYLFPTFTQNYVWTAHPQEGSPNDESITIQTAEGMESNADIGISYRINPKMVSVIFQKYRKGIDEITDIYLRNMVRDAMVGIGSTKRVEDIYGVGKAEYIAQVQQQVTQQVKDIGIIIEKIYLIGSMRLPQQVVAALNMKIQATQKAEQRENELREAEAEAKKVIAAAQGQAKATIMKSEAEAEANRKVADSLTPELVRYEIAKKWDGKLPQMTGAGVPLIDLK